MRNYFKLLITLLSVLVFYACSIEKIDPDDVELGYAYYPIGEGRFWEYEVEKTTYSLDNMKEVDTFYVREEITAVDFDFDHDLKQIARYIKQNESDSWVLDSLWTTKRTSTQALRTEQNTRKIKMVFPVEPGQEWNGNNYNAQGNETYSYADIGSTFTVLDKTYSNTLKVLIGPNLPPNLIETDQRYEVYADGIGNVYRYFKVLGHQPPAYDTVGIKQISRLINYGQ